MPAIMVDMSPASAAPQTQPMDVAPGPEMQQADASPPEVTPPETVQELIAPTPPQDKPEVEAPPGAEGAAHAAKTRARQDRPGARKTHSGKAKAGPR